MKEKSDNSQFGEEKNGLGALNDGGKKNSWAVFASVAG